MFTERLLPIPVDDLPSLPGAPEVDQTVRDLMHEQGRQQFAERSFNRFMTTYVDYPSQADTPEIKRPLHGGETAVFNEKLFTGMAANGDMLHVRRGERRLFAATANLYESPGRFREWLGHGSSASGDIRQSVLEPLVPPDWQLDPYLMPRQRLLLDRESAWLIDGLIAGAEFARPFGPIDQVVEKMRAIFEARLQVVGSTSVEASVALLPA